MVDNKIVFPVLELTDWVFDGERVLDAEFEWDGIHHIKEIDFEKHYQRVLVDSNGELLKVTGNNIIKKKINLFWFLTPQKLVVEFNLEMTGRKIPLEDLKFKIISRSSENFHITHNKLISKQAYDDKIKEAKSYLEIIKIAAFVDEE